MATLDYSDVVSRITEYYNVSSAAAWDTINQYNLTPAQAAELIPQYQQYVYFGENGAAAIQDGLYKLYNNAGDVIGYNEVATVPVGNTPSLAQAINSNTQTGTAQYAVKTQFAGNSVIDQQGNVKLSPGVTKYSGGSLIGNILATEVSPAAIIPATAVATSMGKAIDGWLYNKNPAFWDSIGLSTLNPQTWNTITADMGDTGLSGVAKTAIKMLLHLDDSGNTQAYVSEDAYNYIAYALAQAQMFDVGSTEASSSDTQIPYYSLIAHSYSLTDVTNKQIRLWDDPAPTVAAYAAHGDVASSQASGTVYSVLAKGTSDPSQIYAIFASDKPFKGGETHYGQTPSTVSSWENADRSTVRGKTVYYWSRIFPANSAGGSAYQKSFTLPLATMSSVITSSIAYIMVYGTHTSTNPLDGVADQPNATIPDISSADTQQQVADKIRDALGDLYDNRIEQTVVQDDGTVKTIIYYPVPMPNDTTDTTVDNDTVVDTDQPITVILPDGVTIILPDGTPVTGDGTTPVELPSGEYTLPENTIITNNYIYNITNTEGGSQADPTVTDDSADELKNLIISLLTQIGSQTLEDTETQDITDTTDPNPSDTGEGETPPVVVPTGTASSLWSVYNPTLGEINNFGSWLWSNNFVDQLLKLFNDPMQAIIGLHKTFIPPITGSRQNIQVGYLDSGVSCLTVPTQYSTVDCGTVQLPEYFGNVFDYSPYTRVFIYLPFIGFKELDVSQVMRASINVKYRGDAYTGTGLAEVSVTRDGSGGVLYAYGCECAVRYPLSQGSYMGFATAVAGLAVGIASGNVAPALLGFAHGSGRPAVERSGAFSGNSGAMGIKKPYLVVMRPQPAMPRNYQHYSGLPSSTTTTIKNATGLIRVRECHVESIPNATKEERIMIDTALHEGILV